MGRGAARSRRLTPIIARRSVCHDTGLGRHRWPVERTTSEQHQFRRLRTRWEHHADIHHAFLSLACSLICLRRLHSSL